MSWEFLDIFKKADFNKLMFSLAVAGWVVFCFTPISEQIKYYILGFTILASVYCLSGIVVYCYKQNKSKREQKQQRKNRELYNKNVEEGKRIEIDRMFGGLTEANKKILAYIVKKGKTDKYQPNVLHYGKEDYQQVDCFFQIQSNTRIYRTDDPRIISYNSDNGHPCITITNYTNTIALTIEPYLLDLIKMYNQE